MFFKFHLAEEISKILNLSLLFYKVLYPELSNNLVLKRNVVLPKCDLSITSHNYHKQTHVLVQSDTAGHYRAIGDQANVPLKDRSWEEKACLLASCGDLTKIYQ